MHSTNNHGTISYLDKLNVDKHDWVIKVRVLRFWDVLDMNNQTNLLSTEMVLIDEKIIFLKKYSVIFYFPQLLVFFLSHNINKVMINFSSIFPLQDSHVYATIKRVSHTNFVDYLLKEIFIW